MTDMTVGSSVSDQVDQRATYRVPTRTRTGPSAEIVTVERTGSVHAVRKGAAHIRKQLE